MIGLSNDGKEPTLRKPYNIAAWGGIKELLRRKGGKATRDEILDVLTYCWHPNPQHQPNKHFLAYALRRRWLAED
jgi:hypothetical protein